MSNYMANNTYHIITIGCQMNKSDSERAAGYLEEHGFEYSGERSRAGLVILNTCGVRQSAEDRVYGLVNKIKRENPEVKIVITGCLAERNDVQKKLKDKVDLWLPIGEFSIFKQFSISNFPADTIRDRYNYLGVKPKYNSKISAFVPIGNGCNNFCAYCVVPYARGREVWRPAGEILDEVRGLVKRGYKEITLIAQNVNSYKYNANPRTYAKAANSNYANSKKDINFCDLLKMTNDIPGDFWIRFATSHPKDMSDELIKTVAEGDKVCEHIHLPVQAGDDEVLRRMNRGYTVGDYKHLVEKIRQRLNFQFSIFNFQTIFNDQIFNSSKRLPVALTTDVIVGFSGETEEQFNNTVRLFEEVKFDMAYIAQYSPRPGTAAAKLNDDVPKEEKKRREQVLTDVLRRTALENNQKYAGKVAEVLIEGKNRRGECTGRTRTAKNVKIQKLNTKCERGELVKVKIVEANDFGLVGEVMK